MTPSRALHATIICLQAGKVLLVRKEALEWSLPGGKIDPGETQHEAARRELQEEPAYRLAMPSFWAITCFKRRSTGCIGWLYRRPGFPSHHTR